MQKINFSPKVFFCLLLSVFCFLFSVICIPIYAAVPRLINYQARLADKAGAPLEGSYSLTFKIYDAETAGSLLWEEAHQGVVIQKGIFSVLLGSVTNLNLSFDKPYFLEIKVGSEVMSPRQRIASSAYAIRSEIADNTQLLDGQDSLSYRNASNITTGVLSTAQGGTGVSSVAANIPNGVCVLDAKGYAPDNSVDTTALKTAISEVTGRNQNLILSGGSYCFYPQCKYNSGGGFNVSIVGGNYANSDYETIVYIDNYGVGYIKARYITASGEDYWLWLLIDKSTKDVLSMSGAPDHPAYGNSNDFKKEPHPFRNYNSGTQDIVLIEKSQAKVIQTEAKEKNLSVLELVENEYKIDFSQIYPYKPMHSGQYSPDKKPVLVETIPDYIQVRKLVLMTDKDKADKQKLQENMQDAYEAKRLQEENRKQAILDKLGITKEEAKLLLE